VHPAAPLEEITEARPTGIPSRGLAALLKEQRYSTAFFQSSTENFENLRDLVENFGYAEYYPLEPSMRATRRASSGRTASATRTTSC
jgi:hypothetical protein